MLARFLGLDRNPLRRTVDRVQTWTTLALIGAALIGGPLVGWHVGASVLRHAVASAATSGYPVEAVLLADAAVTYPMSVDYAAMPQPSPVSAQWISPDGTRRTGRIAPDHEAWQAGSVVLIHTDRRGNVIDTPGGRDEAARNAVAAGLLTWIGMGAASAAVWFALRRTFDRRRFTRWHNGWMAVEPRWSGRV